MCSFSFTSSAQTLIVIVSSRVVRLSNVAVLNASRVLLLASHSMIFVPLGVAFLLFEPEHAARRSARATAIVRMCRYYFTSVAGIRDETEDERIGAGRDARYVAEVRAAVEHADRIDRAIRRCSDRSHA